MWSKFVDNFSACWRWNSAGAAWVDNTNDAAAGTNFNFLSATNDRVYVGFEREFKGFVTTLSTNGSYTTLVYHVWDGSAWVQIIPKIAYTFNQSKYMLFIVPTSWQPRTFSATDPHTGTLIDSVSRYWLRISATTVTTTAVISSIKVIPEISYATPTQVYQLLQFKQDFTNTGTPSRRAVIELIKRAESKIDYRTRKSWRWNVENTSYETQIQLADYNRWGIPLRKTPILDVYSVSIWSGGSFETLVLGRNQDYFVDNINGIVYISRFFILPAAYSMLGRYSTFSAGEYKRAVQVDYTYGRSAELDFEQFPRAQDAAIKLSAIDIITSSDYSSLVSSSVQNVNLIEKINQWKADVEENLDQLTGLVLW